MDTEYKYCYLFISFMNINLYVWDEMAYFFSLNWEE